MKSKISIILFLSLQYPLLSQGFRDISIISSDPSSFKAIFTPIITDSSFITISNRDFYRVNFLNAEVVANQEFGKPLFPVRNIPIQIPTLTGNKITVEPTKYYEINGLLIPYFPTDITEENKLRYLEEDYYQNFISPPLYKIAEPGFVRDAIMTVLSISPVVFYPSRNVIRIYTELQITVEYGIQPEYDNKTQTDIFTDGLAVNAFQGKFWVTPKSDKPSTVANSVLSQGRWFRFEAPEEGMYKITRNMLASVGIDASTVDPRTIKIYNNSGIPLAEGVLANSVDDLVENAIMVSGESDGKFDEQDYILFYGRGVNFWYFDTLSGAVRRNINPYSTANYYFITSGGANGKRISQKNGLNVPSATIRTTTAAFVYHEEDRINIGKSGREFYGEEFSESNKSRTFTLKLDGLLAEFPINYKTRFINASSANVRLDITENNVLKYSKTLIGYGTDQYTFGIQDLGQFTVSGGLPDNRSNLKFTFNATGSASYGYLDYYEINYTKSLAAINDISLFYSSKTNDIAEYRLSEFSSSDIYVFDVSDYANVKQITSPVLHSGGEYRFQAEESSNYIYKYFACTGSTWKTPVGFSEVKNQNIHGESNGYKYIVISPSQFIEQAQRLADFRSTQAKIPVSSKVYLIDEIYNEFGGGLKDPSAIRNFIRYAYNNWTQKPEYVLLFGDGDYDFRNIEGFGNNFIPAFQTQESLAEIDSYNTDDYYARIKGNDLYIDIAVGRLPVQSQFEAKVIVDKIIRYETQDDKSGWKNTVTLVADDGLTSTSNDGSTHTDQSEDLDEFFIPKSMDKRKIYLAVYPTSFTSLGRRKPDVNTAIIQAVNEGTLILNYIGHGSPELWAHEQVFVKDVSIPLFRNKNPFFLTAATCDFGYFDKTSGQSALEVMLLLENYGAVGGFTSTRPVYSILNAAINNEFYDRSLNSARDTLNLPIPIGKAYLQTKAFKIDKNDQKYHLFSDPLLRLNLPQYGASVDSINGSGLTTDVQVKALQNISIQGRVLKPDNSEWQDFNGEAIISIYDSEKRQQIPEFGSTYYINLQGGVIFKGRVSVVNGKFQSSFVVPKDISYENRNGRIVAYFFNEENDGIAFTSKIRVGGTDTTNINDNAGPKIEILFDDEKFDGATLINPNSKLIVKLEDETGLNATGTGVGHKLEAILNDNVSNTIDLTNYFTSDLNSGGTSGKVEYGFTNLAVGDYKIEVKAWDVFNNSNSNYTFFTVVEGGEATVGSVLNYPNPFSSATTFLFQHNFTSPVDVKIKIFSVAGRLLNEIEHYNIEERYVRINWDGRDKDGNYLANGVYLYKLIVKTGNDSKQITGSLAITR